MKPRVLIKIGGRAFEQAAAFAELAQDILTCKDKDIALVHGGGVQISDALKKANRESVFIDGIRVTWKKDIKIVDKVLSRQVNKAIAAHLKKQGVPVKRLSGKSGQLITAERMIRNGQDIGYVGRVAKVDPAVLVSAWARNRTPVVSPISADANGDTYNINADTAAGAIAGAVGARDIVYFSDVAGVIQDEQVINELSAEQVQTLIADGVIHGGMIAKMESAFDALGYGAGRVHITRWQGTGTLKKLLNNELELKTTIYGNSHG
ncbi:MAG: acetylglutamate kinase [candidate division KSB1 bacterium]|nr:acetylglutamate kinase [candidate division KSB1 bacterium]